MSPELLGENRAALRRSSPSDRPCPVPSVTGMTVSHRWDCYSSGPARRSERSPEPVGFGRADPVAKGHPETVGIGHRQFALEGDREVRQPRTPPPTTDRSLRRPHPERRTGGGRVGRVGALAPRSARAAPAGTRTAPPAGPASRPARFPRAAPRAVRSSFPLLDDAGAAGPVIVSGPSGQPGPRGSSGRLSDSRLVGLARSRNPSRWPAVIAA